MTRAANTKILISLDGDLAEVFKVLLEDAGFRNIELRPDDDRKFFASFRPGDYGLFIVQPSSLPAGMSTGDYGLFVAQPRSRPAGMMYGLELLSEVRQRDRRARFLVVSGSKDEFLQSIIRQNGFALGDYTYLSMPFEPDALLAAVDCALGDHNETAA